MNARKIEHASTLATTALGAGLASGQLGTWILNAPYDRTFGVVLSAVLLVALVANIAASAVRTAGER